MIDWLKTMKITQTRTADLDSAGNCQQTPPVALTHSYLQELRDLGYEATVNIKEHNHG